jgi:hypothetical protein
MPAAIIEPAARLLNAESVYSLVLALKPPSSGGLIRDFDADRDYGWTPGVAPAFGPVRGCGCRSPPLAGNNLKTVTTTTTSP